MKLNDVNKINKITTVTTAATAYVSALLLSPAEYIIYNAIRYCIAKTFIGEKFHHARAATCTITETFHGIYCGKVTISLCNQMKTLMDKFLPTRTGSDFSW